MPISIFETRRANVRFEDNTYEPLQMKLKRFTEKCEKLLSGIKPYLCLRWDITETVLYDEDRETVPGDFDNYLVNEEEQVAQLVANTLQ
jgi:hypothetical protein